MERVSLTPLTHSDFERPIERWWSHAIPPLRRVPAFAWQVSLNAGGMTWQAIRVVRRRTWPLLATPWADAPGGPMPAARVARRAACQLLWLAPGLLIVSATATWLAARPPDLSVLREPARVAGLYAERIDLVSLDGEAISAIWMPATSARQIALDGDGVLRDRRPAVVLVHDAGHDERQMLPHARRLHEQGFHVLALQTRSGRSTNPAAITFGNAESLDVAAAVDHLRNRPTVDGQRIAAWGVGHGATAVRNAIVNPPLSLAVYERAPDEDEDLSVLPEGRRFDALRPGCRWLMAIAFDAGPRGKPSTPRRCERVVRAAQAYDLIASHFTRALQQP